MKWITLESNQYRQTLGMEVPGGVLVRVREWGDSDDSDYRQYHTMCLVPDCRIMEGGCSERAKLVKISPIRIIRDGGRK